MSPPQQKIIQKRVQRRERYVKMARLRYRKENSIIAKSQIFADIGKSIDNHTLVYQYSPGIYFGERNGGIDCDSSMLNKNYVTNCVNIVKEGDTKLVQLKVRKNSTEVRSPNQEELGNWKKKENPCWAEWAERFTNFSVTYNNFLMKHKEKFTTGKLDEKARNRHKEYLKRRKELMTTKNCVEIKIRFNLEEDYVSEITYNSIHIDDLGYTIEEFVDKILKEGILRIKCTENDNGLIMRTMMENFDDIFEKTLEFNPQRQLRLMGKDQTIKTGNDTILISGFFFKKRGELSYMMVHEDLKPLPVTETLLQSIHIPVPKEDTFDPSERKAFLEKYYTPKPNSSGAYCNIKEVEVSTDGWEDSPLKQEADECKTINDIGKCNNYADKNHFLNSYQFNKKDVQNINLTSNTMNFQFYSGNRNLGPIKMPYNPNNELLQSYMLMNQTNQF